MYARLNYNGATTQSEVNLLAVIVKMLCGETTVANLLGKFLLSNEAVGITNTSLDVTWGGALTNVTCAVGQTVKHPSIPAGATIASITDGVGFTLNTSHAATATDSGAVLVLGGTATLPSTSIGKGVTVTLNSNTTVNLTGASTSGVAVGQKVTGKGIAASTTVASVSTNSFTLNNAATISAVSSLIIEPGSAITDTTNSYILNTYSNAGWEVWDSLANAGKPTKMVLRQPLWDDATNYHYIQLDCSTTGYMQIHQFEGWNNVTHAATNQTNAFATASQQRTTITVSAVMLISSSPEKLLMQSNIAAGIGGSNKNEWTGVFQRTRKSPWDTVANAYPPIVLASGASSFYGAGMSYCPRYKNPAGGDYTTTNAALTCVMLGWGSSANLSASYGPANTGWTQYQKIPDGLGGFYTPLAEISYQYTLNAFMGGSISAVCDVWFGVAYPNNLDEMAANGKTYVLWQNSLLSSTTGMLAIPKG